MVDGHGGGRFGSSPSGQNYTGPRCMLGGMAGGHGGLGVAVVGDLVPLPRDQDYVLARAAHTREKRRGRM